MHCNLLRVIWCMLFLQYVLGAKGQKMVIEAYTNDYLSFLYKHILPALDS